MQNNSNKAAINSNSNVPKRLQKLAHLLDSSIPLPGGRSLGIEAIIGLIPGVGDVFGALASSYIVAEGIGLGAPKRVIVKMVFNVLLESTIGVVPIVGDLFDMVFKSNIRNIKLLDNLPLDRLQTEPPLLENKQAKKKSRDLRWPVFAVAAISVLFIIWLAYRVILFAGSALLQLIT